MKHSSGEDLFDVIVVGAGVAGLTAAARLKSGKLRVRVIDKSRGVGGRMASRRIGGATIDHGAQTLCATDPLFAGQLAAWEQAGVARHCIESGAVAADGEPRWCGSPAMTAIPRHLAKGVDVVLGHRVSRLSKAGPHWDLTAEHRERMRARAILLTPPVPQSLALLDASDVRLPAAFLTQLEAIEYQRCITVLATLDAPASLPTPVFGMTANSPVTRIADNRAKGVSTLPAVTLQASDAFSRARWNDDRNRIGEELIEWSAPFLNGRVQSFQVHGWLYSTPLKPLTTGFLMPDETPPLLFAGDAFGGPTVEGAWQSGLQAADAILNRLNTI